MSESQAAQPGKKTVGLNQAYVSGQVEHVRQYKDLFYHLVKIPQETGDYRYSYIEISAKSRKASAGDQFQGLVNLAGIRNDIELKNGPNAGDIVKAANNWLMSAE